MRDDTISRQAVVDLVEEVENKRLKGEIDLTYAPMINGIKALPPAQQTTLTADDIKTIRIHLSAFKEKLCNQGRWTEAAEYERLIQRLTGEGGQDETEQ